MIELCSVLLRIIHVQYQPLHWNWKSLIRIDQIDRVELKFSGTDKSLFQLRTPSRPNRSIEQIDQTDTAKPNFIRIDQMHDEAEFRSNWSKWSNKISPICIARFSIIEDQSIYVHYRPCYTDWKNLPRFLFGLTEWYAEIRSNWSNRSIIIRAIFVLLRPQW